MRFRRYPSTIAVIFFLTIHALCGGLRVGHVAVALVMACLEIFSTRWQWFLRRCLPILTYLLLYDLIRYIPTTLRPAIAVDTLYRWEVTLFGGLPHEWLSHTLSPFLDILAAIPYNLHFYIPFIFLGVLWKKGRPLIAPFAMSFGLMNIAALVTQQSFPTASPWYYDLYQFAPASYDLPGDPAGLARVDALLGISYFTSLYRMSAIVFGAFPSMHGAWPLLMSAYAWRSFRRLRWVLLGYGGWMWWAALYLHHHYAIDLLGGALYAAVAFVIVVPQWCTGAVQADRRLWRRLRSNTGEMTVVKTTTKTVTP
ncbi:MAG: inositol phosphorylceramide synthase [Deltaproteobacteria bacterium]|nr:inositol phosphorylceramide synthase [Deltaproteobacteria bacterium]